MKIYKRYQKLKWEYDALYDNFICTQDELWHLQNKVKEQESLIPDQAENLKLKYVKAVEALKMIKTIETSMRVEAFQKAGDLEAPQSVSLAEAIAEGVLSELGELNGV